MNTRVRETVLAIKTPPQWKGASIPALNDADTEQQIFLKRTELINQKQDFETRVFILNTNITSLSANRYRAGRRIAPNGFESEQAWYDERTFLILQIRKIDKALAALSGINHEEDRQTFEHNFMSAAKDILRESLYEKIVIAAAMKTAADKKTEAVQ